MSSVALPAPVGATRYDRSTLDQMTVEPTPILGHNQEGRVPALASSPDEGVQVLMTRRQLRLDTGQVFVRLALAFFAVREAYVWLVWMRRLRIKHGMRLLIFLFHKWATPHSIVYALLFGALATGFLAMLVRLVIGPLVRRWHAPRGDESAGLFHVAANERVLFSAPCRRREGRLWLPGMLVRTNLRLWFFPRAHDAEIWSRPLAVLRNIHLEPERRTAWGCVHGWPRRLALDAGEPPYSSNLHGDGTDEGGHEVFATAEPEAVLAWFGHPGSLATQPPVVQPISSPGRA
jgi:hypothetical protein